MSLKLPTPSAFSAFPFEPYGIQLDLMQHLYTCIENRQITIVESPTGTGKTLSLLCASLTWLKDEQDRARMGELDALREGDDGPDWVLAQTIDRRRRELEAADKEYAERLAKARQMELKMMKLAKASARKRQKASVHDDAADEDDEREFLPDNDISDGDEEESNISPAVRALMGRLQKGKQVVGDAEQEQEPVCTKIYYASRTHSQLAQVLHELRKLKITLDVAVPSSPQDKSFEVVSKGKRPLPELDDSTAGDDGDVYTVRAVSLGSRKQLCINDELRRRAGDLDEACRQMLGEKGKKRCSYLPPPEDDTRMLDLRDQILATPKDIEDLVNIGQNAETCPYFGTRKAIPQAQLVLLPYNLLLQKSAREALGVDLSNQVVIIDEAHNLISTLLSLSTTRLPFRTLSTAGQQLSIYLSRFRTRLSTIHALHLTRLKGILDALQRYAEEWQHGPKEDNNKTRVAGVEVMTPGELLQRLGRKTEGVNLLEIEAYLRSSKIARKISGYSLKALEKAAGQDPSKLAKVTRLSTTTPPLHAVESFIIAITSANDDGRVTLSVVDNQVEFKYQHLNPSTHFKDVVHSARSVILAGGTMSPISDIKNQLFASLPNERLATFSCGHIIPPSNLQTIVLRKGPRGSDLQFKYDQRSNQALIAELGQVLFNFASIVPGGMVVFLPSYGFLDVVQIAWQSSGLLDKLKSKKKVFSEPQESTQVETVLREYTCAIHDTMPPSASKKSGALLFAVIGAKLSEGLNFTDDLARAVIIIGLPFANLASPELRERMSYVNRLEQSLLAGSGASAKKVGGPRDAASELYENMCMNAVNQSIGRAIRHRGDWASLILIDGRYASSRIRDKLPKWIGQNTLITEGFGHAVREMGKFYREKRIEACNCT